MDIITILETVLFFIVAIGSIVWSLRATKRMRKDFEALGSHKVHHD